MSSKIIPIFRLGVNEDNFVSTEYLKPWTEVVKTFKDYPAAFYFKTSALKANTVIALLNLSFDSKLEDLGAASLTDTIDPVKVHLDKFYFMVDGEVIAYGVYQPLFNCDHSKPYELRDVSKEMINGTLFTIETKIDRELGTIASLCEDPCYLGFTIKVNRARKS